ncbi:MAG: cytidylate kinase-like family protein [Chloroflexota bacterium]|nr:cytidylate kinase-like family protein [Chloroflexota bacterium]
MAQLFRGRGQTRPPRRKSEGATQLLPETMWANETMPPGIPPEDHVVVTISRQFGSGGAEIGSIVAERSQLTYLDEAIIAAVARRLGVNVEEVARQDEQTAGIAGHILESMQMSHPFTANYSTLFGQEQMPLQSREAVYLHLTQKVILEVATEGNAVIIGRGSQFLLHNVPRTLHIYVFAPLADRIANVMKRFQLDYEQAQRLIERRDHEHNAYVRHYYGFDGKQPNLYHLLINTGLFSFELAADLIQQALPLAKDIGQKT